MSGMTAYPSIEKSEILFFYESTYSIPNGDPFTGEQRIDEETKKILVSDVRIKRFIRDYLAEQDPGSIFVMNDRSAAVKGDSGSAARTKALKITSVADFQKMIDVRLFGGIVTLTGNAFNLTGPVQFALLNPSLNKVDLRMHQNTSVFASSVEKTRGAIGTTTVVPYALNQIHGWINALGAKQTGLQSSDITTMFRALWDSVNNANTRTKSNQNSMLLIQVVYKDERSKVPGLSRAIRLKPTEDRREEQIRSDEDYLLDFSKLSEITASEKVAEVRYYTESPSVDEKLKTAFTDNTKLKPLAINGQG